jgi:type II secretory pathway pseudopilin PulG
MKLLPPPRTNRATTLVEVVVAILILAILGAGVLGSFKYGFFMMDMARENQRATQILLAKAETIRLYRWDQVLSNGFIPATFTNFYDEQSPVGQQGAAYYGTVAISNFPVSTVYQTNMRQLSINLQWTTRTILRKRSLVTFIARDGLQNYVY